MCRRRMGTPSMELREKKKQQRIYYILNEMRAKLTSTESSTQTQWCDHLRVAIKSKVDEITKKEIISYNHIFFFSSPTQRNTSQ